MTTVKLPSTPIKFSDITRLVAASTSLGGLRGSLPGIPSTGAISFSDFAGKSQLNHKLYNISWHRNDLNFVAPSSYSLYIVRSTLDGDTLLNDVLNGSIDRLYLVGSGMHFAVSINPDPAVYGWNGSYWSLYSSPLDSSVLNTQLLGGRYNFTAQVYGYKFVSPEVLYTRV